MTPFERAETITRDEIAAMLDERASLETRVDELQRQLDWFKRQLFGEKSERLLHTHSARQLSLGEGGDEASTPEPAKANETAVTSHTRRKRRSPGDVLAEGLRFDESVPMTVIELVDGDIDGVAEEDLVLVDEERTYRLAQRPAAYEIVCYARKAYKHKRTDQFYCAPVPASVLERSCADVSILAGLLVDKLLYHRVPRRQTQLSKGRCHFSRASPTFLIHLSPPPC